MIGMVHPTRLHFVRRGLLIFPLLETGAFRPRFSDSYPFNPGRLKKVHGPESLAAQAMPESYDLVLRLLASGAPCIAKGVHFVI